jgi:hypothetical protein
MRPGLPDPELPREPPAHAAIREARQVRPQSASSGQALFHSSFLKRRIRNQEPAKSVEKFRLLLSAPIEFQSHQILHNHHIFQQL